MYLIFWICFQIDSDEETVVNGNNGTEKIGNIDEIIGVNNNSLLSNASEVKEKSDEAEVVKCTSTKTSIMTMSSGKTMQSHHKKTNEKNSLANMTHDEDDDEVEKMDTTEDDEECSPEMSIKIIDDRKIEKMDTVEETLLMSTGNGLGEITITPIVKTTTDAKIVKQSVEEVRKSTEVNESSVSIQTTTTTAATTTIATSIAQPITIN